MKSYKNVDSYILAQDHDKQALLSDVRAIVLRVAKDAEESISYGMPAYKWHGKPLFYFAAMKGHLGLYPTPSPIKALTEELADYSISKGCVRIPYSTKLPKTLIQKLLTVKMAEIRAQID